MIDARHNHPQARSAARRYKSKHQRPCDFCRRRRAACRIESTGPPCGLCKAYGRECTFAEAPPPRSKPAAAVLSERCDDEPLVPTATGNGLDLAVQSDSTSSPIVATGNGQGNNVIQMNSAHGVGSTFGPSVQEAMAPVDMQLHQIGSNGNDQQLGAAAQMSFTLSGEDTGTVLDTALDFEDMDFASALQYADDMIQPPMQLGLDMLPSSVVGETDASRPRDIKELCRCADSS